jgi:hypothetical protein
MILPLPKNTNTDTDTDRINKVKTTLQYAALESRQHIPAVRSIRKTETHNQYKHNILLLVYK